MYFAYYLCKNALAVEIPMRKQRLIQFWSTFFVAKRLTLLFLIGTLQFEVGVQKHILFCIYPVKVK